ncbi:hypothetical protein, partial [Pseudoalteromonas citrea]|uniref:hypothetical protein n=1 Tax=Pseudoalteromonas citrea TaxID=43655 RepID=UPI003D80AD7A
MVLRFADTQTACAAQSQLTLSSGYQAVFDAYNGKGEAIGWEDYIASLEPIAQL